MFPNNSTSNIDSPTIINNYNSNNNSCSNNGFCGSKHINELVDRHVEIVIVTDHPSVPCPRLYTDIFKTILIICKDPSHKDDKYTEDDDSNRIIKQLLSGEAF